MAARAVSAKSFRSQCRSGESSAPRGQPDYLQVELVILPKDQSEQFRTLCELNPHMLPLVACACPGSFLLPVLGDDVDVRTDAPLYRVHADGAAKDHGDVTGIWRDDLVTFALAAVAPPEDDIASTLWKCELSGPQGTPLEGRLPITLPSRYLADGQTVEELVEKGCQTCFFIGLPLHIERAAEGGVGRKRKANEALEGADAVKPILASWPSVGETVRQVLQRAAWPFAITTAPGGLLATDLPRQLAGPAAASPLKSPAPANQERIERITEIVLEGDVRGMRALVDKGHVPNGAFGAAADLVLSRPRGVCVVVTGFYILKAETAETDGPPGAAALGNALAKLGFDVVYLCDRFSVDAVAACSGPSARIIAFPVTTPELSTSFARGILNGLKPSLIVSVERCGLGKDGAYRNMRGLDFSAMNARIDAVFELAEAEQVPSIGVADGGNEIGCGALTASGAIPGADPEKLMSPPCVTKTTQTLVGASSNWGAFGLTAALALSTNRPELVPSVEEGWELVRRSVSAGAVDGILHTKGLASVDGRGEGPNSAVLQKLHELL